MIRRHPRGFIAAAGLAACLLVPAPATAQVHGHVVVGAGFYHPYYFRPYYYRPYFYPFYSPFYFGFGAFYDGFYGAWYPYGPYPYPYPAYSPYPGYYSGAWATARIEVKPREAQVYLDGYYVGIVNQFDGVFQRLDIPGGEHELAIYMPGYHTIREKTLFRPGQGYHFKETMQPLPAGEAQEPKPQPEPRAAAPQEPYRQPPPPPQEGPRPLPPPGGGVPRAPEFGTLNLRVQPPDAIVTIDGERWDSPEGGSRLSVQLPAGSHRVEVRKDGFRSYAQTIEIRRGEPQTLNISLPKAN